KQKGRREPARNAPVSSWIFSRLSVSGGQGFERVHEVGLFPREAAVGVRRPAEMAIGGAAAIDGLVQAQMLADGARRGAADQLGQFALQHRLVDLARAVQ